MFKLEAETSSARESGSYFGKIKKSKFFFVQNLDFRYFNLKLNSYDISS